MGMENIHQRNIDILVSKKGLMYSLGNAVGFINKNSTRTALPFMYDRGGLIVKLGGGRISEEFQHFSHGELKYHYQDGQEVKWLLGFSPDTTEEAKQNIHSAFRYFFEEYHGAKLPIKTEKTGRWCFVGRCIRGLKSKLL